MSKFKKLRREDTRSNSVDSEKLERELFEWANSHGAVTTNIQVVTQDAMRGCIATTDVAGSDMIVHIPSALVLSEAVVAASELGKALLAHEKDHGFVASKTDPAASKVLRFAAFLAFEHFHTENSSFWTPYLASLPKSFETMPIEWPLDQVQSYLGDTNMMFKVVERRKMIVAALEFYNGAILQRLPSLKCVLMFEDMLWACSVLQSRAFSRKWDNDCADMKEDHLTQLCLYPVIDLFNHERGKPVEWDYMNGVTFKLTDGVNKGATIWNNYGAKSNEIFLSNYGFILLNNPDDTATITLNINKRDPRFKERRASLKRHNIPTEHILRRNSSQINESLIAATHILVANGRELSILEATNGIASFLGRLHLLALNTLYVLLNEKVVKIVAGMPAVTAATGRESSVQLVRMRMAQVYRQGQIDVMSHTRKLCLNATQQLLGFTESGANLHFLTLHNPLLSGAVMKAVYDIDDEEEVLDPETVLALVLMHEESLGAASNFHDFFVRTSRSLIEAKEILSGQVEAIERFFSDQVLPVLHRNHFFAYSTDTFSSSRFVWATSLAESHGLSLCRDLLQETDCNYEKKEGSDEMDDSTIFGICTI